MDESELFARGAFRLIGFDRSRVVLVPSGSADAASLPRRVGEMLASCTEFVSLGEHARRICRAWAVPPAQAAEVAALLSRAAENGLLVSHRELLESVGAQDGQSERVPILSIGVVSKDRPQALRRCLRSFAEHLRPWERRVRLVVVDSSAVPERHALSADRRLERELGSSVRRIGLQEKEIFARELAKETNVDPAIVRFAIIGVPGHSHDVGANRNALLLALAGEAFLSTDDDMICDLRVPPGSREQLRLSSDEVPVDVTLHPDFPSARASLLSATGCVLDGHEQLLGRRLSACLSERDEVACHSLEPKVLSSVLADEAEIVATFGGYYGDAGASHPSFYIWSTQSVRQQLRGEADAYRRLVASRQMVRLAPVATVSSSRFSMGGNVALDTRRMLPPFFPILRGEDLSFGMLLRACFPHALFGHLPDAVAHVPWQARNASPDRLWSSELSVPMVMVTTQVLEMIEACGRMAAGGERRLRLMGRCIREMAGLPLDDLNDLLRERVTLAVSRTAARRSALLEQEADGPPSAWAVDLRAHLEHQLRVCCHPDRHVPRDLRGDRTAEEGAILLRELLDRYGRLLEAWPDLFEAAVRLRFADRNAAGC